MNEERKIETEQVDAVTPPPRARVTPEFERSLQDLIERAKGARAALLCAEAVPWRCHRSLIADALVARGVPVEHIMSPTRRQPHTLRPFARVRGARVTYPPEE